MNTKLLSSANLSTLEIAKPEEPVTGTPLTSAPEPESPLKKIPTPVSILRQTWQWVLVAFLALAAYWFFSRCVFQSVQVVGASMLPTLHDSDRYFLNRWAYYLHSPQHRDIVVLKDPTDGAFAVKRIIATPGDSVYFKKGQVYINDVPLREPYLADDNRTVNYMQPDEEHILTG